MRKFASCKTEIIIFAFVEPLMNDLLPQDEHINQQKDIYIQKPIESLTLKEAKKQAHFKNIYIQTLGLGRNKNQLQ